MKNLSLRVSLILVQKLNLHTETNKWIFAELSMRLCPKQKAMIFENYGT